MGKTYRRRPEGEDRKLHNPDRPKKRKKNSGAGIDYYETSKDYPYTADDLSKPRINKR